MIKVDTTEFFVLIFLLHFFLYNNEVSDYILNIL